MYSKSECDRQKDKKKDFSQSDARSETFFFLSLQFVKKGFMDIHIYSEIGELQGVILHRPGCELERMVPGNIRDALYSDILSMEIARQDYAVFEGVLQKQTKVFYVRDLLEQMLADADARKQLTEKVCRIHQVSLQDKLDALTVKELAGVLIEGWEEHDSIGRHYPIPPLYNLYFTRDASASLYDEVIINRMRHSVRNREALLMEEIFRRIFHAETFRPDSGHNIEGGDLLVAREDVLLIGQGDRTSRAAIEDLTRRYLSKNKRQHIVVQELPVHPESFIHLDMVFTFLDRDACACFLPLIAKESRYRTTVITIDGGQVSYREEPTLLQALKKLRFDLEPISCGAPDDEWNQQREQWHSGANFVALEPGKVIGYARNTRTIDQLNRHGFDVVPAADVASGKVTLDSHKRCVVTLRSDELPRGGGGGRCMTMPINREKVIW